MNILSKDILPLKTSQKFSSVLEPYAVKVASTVLRRGCHCEVMFLSDNIGVSNPNNIVLNYKRGNKEHNLILEEEKDNELVISFYSIY